MNNGLQRTMISLQSNKLWVTMNTLQSNKFIICGLQSSHYNPIICGLQWTMGYKEQWSHYNPINCGLQWTHYNPIICGLQSSHYNPIICGLQSSHYYPISVAAILEPRSGKCWATFIFYLLDFFQSVICFSSWRLIHIIWLPNFHMLPIFFRAFLPDQQMELAFLSKSLHSFLTFNR